MKHRLLFFLILAAHILLAQQKFGFAYTGIYKLMENGDSLKNAWAGGVNQPQFSTIDLNLDGTNDLLVFDRSGNRIMPFLRVTIGGQPRYRYAPQYRKYFPTIENWMQLRDYNCDGKPDIFCYVSSGMGVYKNVSDTVLRFEWALGNRPYLESVYSSKTNLYVMDIDMPAIADVDYDGDLDIFTFGLGSSLEYHQNSVPCGLEYHLESQCWGRFEENQLTSEFMINACPPSVKKTDYPNPPLDNRAKTLHAGSSTLMLDLNGDSLHDILVGDVSFTTAVAGYNFGTRDSAVVTQTDTIFPSTGKPIDVYLFPAFYYEDVTFDGIPDLLVSPNEQLNFKDKNGVWFYKNTGTKMNPNFSFQDSAFLQRDMVDRGAGAFPVLADLNTDGLSDLVISNYGRLRNDGTYETSLSYYQNTGSYLNPKFELVTHNLSNISALNIGQNLLPTFGDLDGDIDLDMVLGAQDGKLYYFINTGGFSTPSFAISQPNWLGIDVGNAAAPQLFDVDNDGDLDLVIGNEMGTLSYYANNGSSPVSFTLMSNNFGGVDMRSRNTLQGFSVPWFVRQGDTLTLFVGSNDQGIIQFDSIADVMNQPATIFQTIGTGTVSTTDVHATPFGASKRNGRNHFLYRASDLKALGFTYGKITQLAFFIPTVPGSILSQGFAVSMKNVQKQTLSGFETGLTEVFNYIFPFSSGWNSINLTTPFLWDGSSDLLIEICFSKNFQSVDIPVQCTDVGYAVNAFGDVNNWNGVTQDGCLMPYLGASTLRPNIQLTLVPTFVQTEVVVHDGARNAITLGDLTGDQYLDAIVGSYSGGVTFFKGVQWQPNTFGVDEKPGQHKQALVIYPNPANQNALVLLPAEMHSEKTNFSLYDMGGRMMLNQTATATETEIDLSHLAPGVYILMAKDDAQTRHARIVISR